MTRETLNLFRAIGSQFASNTFTVVVTDDQFIEPEPKKVALRYSADAIKRILRNTSPSDRRTINLTFDQFMLHSSSYSPTDTKKILDAFLLVSNPAVGEDK